MKYLLPALVLILYSCTKKDVGLNTGWNAMYHIENDDTLSYIYFPNSFSPGGDGINDLYRLTTEGISYSGYEMKILRTNGEELFRSTDLINGWDGTSKGVKAVNGLYYYKITAEDYTGFKYDANGSMYLCQ